MAPKKKKYQLGLSTIFPQQVHSFFSEFAHMSSCFTENLGSLMENQTLGASHNKRKSYTAGVLILGGISPTVRV